MTIKDELSWFESWFNSHYYHILYKNRNNQEAEFFINNLCDFLVIPKNSKILDLACGKGRHSIQLNAKGFNVIGTDLSKESILEASKHKKVGLDFFVNDMRLAFKTNYFDYTFNFFSSFGYFESDAENIDVLRNISLGLKKNGILAIDFMNIKKVIENLKPREEKTIDGIIFKISRAVKNGFLIKNIELIDQNKELHFQEKVKIITLEDFKDYLKQTGFKIINLLGDYDLNTFDELNSDRLIIVAIKE